MTTTQTTVRSGADVPSDRRAAVTAFSACAALATLAIVLQGLWAGIFLEYGDRPRPASWKTVHARGGEVALALALLAFLVAVAKLRQVRILATGAAVLVVLLAVEAFLGGRITKDGKASLTIVHVPLGMAIMGVAVWLSLTSVQVLRRSS